MSSKFTRTSVVQQPPSVCRKPPTTPLMPFPDIPDRILLAYVIYTSGIQTPPFYVASKLNLYPTAAPDTWTGSSRGTPDNVRVTLEWIPAKMTVDVLLEAMRGNFPIHTTGFADIPLVSLNPFQTRLIHKIPASTWDRQELQIYQ